MALENDKHLQIDEDTKSILLTLLNSDNILKYLTITPTSSTHNVTLEPSIVAAKSIGQRFNEYYLSDDPIFTNWQNAPTESSTVKGRISFFPGKINLRGSMAPCQYIFDCLLPFEWHKKTNVAFKVVRELVKLFKDTHLFGEVGVVNFEDGTPITSVNGYVGYRLICSNYNFVK